MADRLLKFMIHDAPVRGELMHLREAWQQMIALREYPAPVVRLLGEMTAAALLLSSSIRFNGALILQIHGDGPVRLLVVECQSDLTVRATAKLSETVGFDDDASLASLVNRGGQGRCAITLDPTDRLPGRQPYQGVVPLAGDSIATVLEDYMRRSEQIETRLWLAADAHAAAGVLLQKLPQHGGLAQPASNDDDAWDRAVALAATVTRPELLASDPATLGRRLFCSERLDHYAPLTPRFKCACSRARIGRMLVAMGRAEIESIVVEHGRVGVTCEFCNARQEFDAIDVGQLFATGSATGAESSAAH